jgi:hypothetical protein
VATIRTWCSGSPSTSHTSERVKNRACVLVQIVSAPGRVHGRHRRPGLEVALVHHRRGVAALDDDIGLGEPAGDITPVEVLGADHVRTHVLVETLSPCGGGHHVHGRSQGLVRDLHEAGRVLRDRRRLRHDRGDRLPDEEDAVGGEGRPGARRRVRPGRPQAPGGDDAHDAGHRLGRLGVDPREARVRMRAQDEPDVQHVGELDVRGEAGEPDHLLGPVDPPHGPSD